VAILHRADVRPTKLELLSGWLPDRPWSGGAGTDLSQLGSFRFDDPAGEVGVETLIVRAGAGAVLQVPLTYRAGPADGQEDHLIGTLQHSVLGRRWVYDGCGDPVYVSALAAALDGGSQAAEFVDVDGRLEPREPTAHVVASGPSVGQGLGSAPSGNGGHQVTDGERSTVVRTGPFELLVVRALDVRGGAAPDLGPAGRRVLTGTWGGQREPVVLAELTAR
jgi:hypothetical protein